jgi:hypothetical protein
MKELTVHEFRDPVSTFIDSEIAEPPSSLLRSSSERMKKSFLGIGDSLYEVPHRQIQWQPASRVSRCRTNRHFVQDQPGFCHSDRNHAHRWRVYRRLSHGTLYLFLSMIGALSLGVSVNKQKITGIILHRTSNAVF